MEILELLCILLFVLTTTTLRISFEQTIITSQQTLPVPLHSYKGPQSVIYGRVTIPNYAVSAKLSIHVGASKSCHIPSTHWTFAHQRYPYLNFKNRSHPSDIIVVPNEIDMSLDGDSQRIIIIENPHFGDWFWGVIINESYQEQMKQSGLARQANCMFRAMIQQITAIVDEPDVASASGDIFQMEINASASATRRFQPPLGSLSVRLELLECNDGGNNTYGLDSCPVLAYFSQSRMPFVLQNSSNVPYTSAGLNNTWKPLRSDDQNFFRLYNLLKAERLLLKLRFQVERKCALAQHLANVVPPQPERCVLMPEMNRVIDFMIRFRYFLTYNTIEGSPPFRIVMSSNRYITSFRIRNGEDQGATLNVAISADPQLSDEQTDVEVRVTACLSLAPVLGESDDHCLLRIVASSSSKHDTSLYMPYPRIGIMYLVLWRTCYSDGVESACMNTSTALVRISGRPCIDGQCGSHGSCVLVTSRDVQLGACQCKLGYAGFSCTDASNAVPSSEQLMTILLLTVSNVFFIPAIIVAASRRYFVQSLVYFYTMLASTIYHMCDSNTRFSTCLLDYDVLSFCDFYGAIMSLWVTLIALSNLTRGVTELAYVASSLALVIFLGLDRHSLYAFLVPLGVGVALVFVSWLRQWCIRRRCYPQRRWWFAGFIPGVILSTCGIIIFSFFETAANYAYLHSVWHILIALCIVFLLPWKRAPPLCQRNDFFCFSAVRSQSCELIGDGTPLDDGERVSMDSTVLPVDSDWIYGQNEYDRLLRT